MGAAKLKLKLGVFKLAGLNEISVVDEQFEYMGGLYDPSDAKYKGVTLFAIEPESAPAADVDDGALVLDRHLAIEVWRHARTTIRQRWPGCPAIGGRVDNRS